MRMPSKMNFWQWPTQPGKKMGHDLQADLQDFLKPTGGSFVIILWWPICDIGESENRTFGESDFRRIGVSENRSFGESEFRRIGLSENRTLGETDFETGKSLN